MTPLTPPTCEVCGSSVHLFESQTLQVVVCYFCLKATADFLFKFEILTTPSWLKDELLDGVWNCELNNEFSYQVWHRSPYSSTAQMYSMVERSSPKIFEEKA